MSFPSIPISYAIEVTLECNNYCPGCANALRANHREAVSDWKTLFDKIAPSSNRRKFAELIRITGGEPTLHPDFPQIIEYVDTFAIPHATFTNGRWAEPDALIRLFRNCENFIGLLVSLHGSTAEAHQTFLGINDTAFEETCSNIRRAADVGIEVFTNTVLTKYNFEQIEEIIALSHKLGAGYAVFNRYLGKPHPIELTEAQLHHAIQLIETLHTQGVSCRIGDCVPPCFVRNSSSGSNGGIEHCIVSPSGSVRPDNLTTYSFGNLFEQPIEEIWQSERAQWYRNQIPQSCLECIELSRCRGGCRSVMIEYDLESDPLMKEPIREAPAETLEFRPDWKPLPNFTIREESFGYLLCRYDWSVPVTREAKTLIDAINGERTLSELHSRFGEAGLELIGHLYREGCLGFE